MLLGPIRDFQVIVRLVFFVACIIEILIVHINNKNQYKNRKRRQQRRRRRRTTGVVQTQPRIEQLE